MPDVARETRDHPPKRLMGYYDICQTPLFLAANGKRPVHLAYDFSLRQYHLLFPVLTRTPLPVFIPPLPFHFPIASHPYPPLPHPSPKSSYGYKLSHRVRAEPGPKHISVERRPKLGLLRWVEGLAKWLIYLQIYVIYNGKIRNSYTWFANLYLI